VTPLFLDSAFLIALEDRSDQHHKAAHAYWRTHTPTLVTTAYVLDEAVTFFNRRGHHAKAVEIGTYLLASPSVQFIYVDEALFHIGWEQFQRDRDKRYSFTDCISFAVMRQFDLTTALTFDQHFVQAGFTRKPDPKG